MITVLAGGVGAAKFLRGLTRAVPEERIVVIVNTGDDFVLHGLHISPDIDTIRYTLANDVGNQGWGRSNETWTAMAELQKLSTHAPAGSRASDWFSLGDRDLAVHLYRTQRMNEGATLSAATAELTRSAGLGIELLPMSDDPAPTVVELVGGTTVDFQQYFVGLRHSVAISDVRFPAATTAAPAPGVIDAIGSADQIIIAPSNPLVSIGPLFALPAIADAVSNRRDAVVSISPIVGGQALKGPALRMLQELGLDGSAVGVARLWSAYASTLVIDRQDVDLAGSIQEEGMQAVVTDTVMNDLDASTALAQTVLSLGAK